MPTNKTEQAADATPGHVASTDQLGGRSSFAPTVTMPGGGTVTPEGWMWVLGFAMAGCEWAIEAAERDGLQQKAMDYRRRQRIYWQEDEIRELEARLAQARKQLADLQAPNARLSGPQRPAQE
jgi:hypothetical protein